MKTQQQCPVFIVKNQLFLILYNLLNVFFWNLQPPRVLILYLYNMTVWSAAPQTTLWGGPRPRFEPMMGNLEEETLTTRPPQLLNFTFQTFFLFINTLLMLIYILLAQQIPFPTCLDLIFEKNSWFFSPRSANFLDFCLFCSFSYINTTVLAYIRH